jgi:hypothetical protein
MLTVSLISELVPDTRVLCTVLSNVLKLPIFLHVHWLSEVDGYYTHFIIQAFHLWIVIARKAQPTVEEKVAFSYLCRYIARMVAFYMPDYVLR